MATSAHEFLTLWNEEAEIWARRTLEVAEDAAPDEAMLDNCEEDWPLRFLLAACQAFWE